MFMSKEENKSVNKSVILGIIGTILLKTISFVTVIIVGFIMTKSEYGNLSTYNTWISVFSVFVGMQVAGSLQNALKDYGKEEYNSYCSTILFVAIASFVVISLPFYIAPSFFSNLLKIDFRLVFIMIPHCFGSFLIGFMSTYFLTQKMALKNLIYNLFYSIIIAVSSILLAYIFTDKTFWYAIGIAIPNILIGFICLFILLKNGKFSIKVEYIKFSLLFSIPLVMHMLGNIILGQCDKLMIRYIMDEQETANYTMIHNYAMLVNSLWGAINSVFLPYYYDSLKKNDENELKSRVFNYYFFFSSITIGFILVGKELLLLLTNQIYHSSIALFPIMCGAQYLIFVYSFSVNFEFFHTKTVWISIGTIGAALINIVLNYFFIVWWGIMGAAIASLIAYLVLVLFHEIIARVIIKNYKISIWFPIINIIIVSLAILIFYLCYDLWIIRWIIASIIGFVLLFKIIKTRRLI